jgi:hypothetical protein
MKRAKTSENDEPSAKREKILDGSKFLSGTTFFLHSAALRENR